MRFNELPYRLRLYLLAHLLVMVPFAAVLLRRPTAMDGWLLLVLLLCTLIFSTWKIELTVFHAKMTLTFASICMALLLQGVHGAVLCAFVGACVGTIVRPADGSWKVRLLRPPAYRVLFNLANCMLACLVGLVPYELVMRFVPSDVKGMLLGLTVFTASYFAVNTVGVSVAIALEQGLSWRKIWRESFLWTAPGYFASGSAAAGISAAYTYVGLWSLFFVPPLYVVYYSYKLYMDRMRLHSESLTRERDHIHQLNEINHAIIVSLATAIDAKDSGTSSHIDRVQLYATALARAAGLSGPEFEAVKTGALVHDIGKLGVPDNILGKPGKLTPEEFKRIQTHVTIGAEILTPIPFPFPVVDVVRSHHERWDGLGYPDGLKGEDIPIGGRIISIVDVFDALTSDRPYRRAMTHEEALRILGENAGKQFDPRLVDLFGAVLPQVSEEIRKITEAHAEPEPAAEPPVEADGGVRTCTLGSIASPLPGGFAHVQIRKAAAEMASLCDVAHLLAEHETEEPICGVIVERALALLPADTVVLYLREADDDELVAVAVQGKYEEKLRGMTIRLGEGVAGAVATSQQPRVNVSAASDIARRFAPEEMTELSAATAVPLMHGPEVLGVLAVYTMAYSVMNDHHLHLLNTLAEHASCALQSCRHREREQERECATDPITGLANSRHLIRALNRLTPRTNDAEEVVPQAASVLVERSSGIPATFVKEPFAVVMVDLDGFKGVNDALGHVSGDELLVRAGQALFGVVRDDDVVCRYAGDEFVLLLHGVGQDDVEALLDRVRAAIDALPALHGQCPVTASVGAATFPFDGQDARTLLAVADQRMYEEKFQRRSRGQTAAR